MRTCSAARTEALEDEDTDVSLLTESTSDSSAPPGPAWRSKKAVAVGAAAAALAAAALGAAHRLQGPRRRGAGGGSPRSLLTDACAASFDVGEDCGALGQEDCEAAGCCYDPGNALHVCWRPGAPPVEVLWECNRDAMGGDCGRATREQCEAMGCCYDETAQNWCFPKTQVGIVAVDVPVSEVIDVPSTDAVQLGLPAGAGGPSLFCFAVASTGEEHALLSVQESVGAGISACEAWTVLDGAPNDGVGVIASGSLTNSWTNVNAFIGAWRSVAADGRWASHDWTVKADPDCAFFPGRLREWLVGHDPGGGAYIRNCMGVSNGLYGALEVMSRGAVDVYLRELDSCQGEIGEQEGMGEDMFVEKCMDMHGVAGWDYGDLVCNADCGCDPHPCNTGRISYHKFKDAGSMQTCMDEAMH